MMHHAMPRTYGQPRVTAATTALLAILTVGFLQPGFSQTPWEAAPAKPAPTPSAGKSRVVSLPPPPWSPHRKANDGGGSPSAAVAFQMPAHVPLPKRAEPSADDSLIPSSSAFPPLPALAATRSSSPQQGTSPQAFSIPLPPISPQQLRGAPKSPAVAPTASSSRNDTLVAFNAAATGTPEQFDAGKLIAVVGNEHILAGDMAVFIEPIIEKNRDKLRSSSDEDRLRMQLTRQVLVQYVEIKAMYQEFFRDMVARPPPHEIDAMKKQVVTRAGKIFYEKQVANLLDRYEATDLADLEEKLRAKSMSLNTLRTQFIEQVLSQELERKYVASEFEISRAELLDYYQEHRSEWDMPARARWRQLTIRFDKHDRDRTAVETLIKNLGNQVYLGGQPFEAAARQASEGYTADKGGVYDWTTQGSLKSKQIDRAIFSLPLRKLSEVIEDDIGMHIVEVLEREDGHTKDFTLAQGEIRKTLSNEKRDAEVAKFRKKVLARTPIWSLWPEDIKSKAEHVRPLSEAVGEDT